jgi:hypothetical protein
MRAMAGGKPRPNHTVYVSVLRAMTPEQRLGKAFELGAMTRAMFEHGLRRRFPHLGEAALAGLVRERLDRCHNRNY